MTESKPSLWALLYKYKVHHVLLWIGYYVFWVLLFINFYPSIWSLIMVVSVYFIFLAAAFYSTAYYLFPRFLYKQKFGLFFTLFGILTIALSFAQGYILYLMVKGAKDVPNEVESFQNMVQFSLMSIITCPIQERRSHLIRQNWMGM